MISLLFKVDLAIIVESGPFRIVHGLMPTTHHDLIQSIFL